METKKIKVAIIGRPNVGKSTLFNRLLKQRKSIVDDTPGVTRDRLYADIEWNGKPITLIDTGGLIDEKNIPEKEIIDEVKKHVFVAVDEADFVVFMVNGKSGITSGDEKIAKILRKIKDKKKIFLAVNKIDTEKQLDLVSEFYSLGLGEPYPISALSGSKGLADILDEISFCRNIPAEHLPGEIIKVAIVGKPNVGKSSILNCLAGKERSIVSSIAGTTRDSIDTGIDINGKRYLLVDTAGLRRKSKVSSNIERYATTRAIESIEKADIVLLVVDSTEKISDQDQKIASVIKKRNKASIIVVNKWDLIENKISTTINRFEEQILYALHFINYSKILFTSAIEKKNINKIFGLVDEVFENYQRRISTGKLNKILEDIVLLTSPPGKKGKLLKIYYATQANIKPPEIVLFVNDSELVSEQYEKFLEKEIRKAFDFTGSPIKMVFRNKAK
ncbi:MAG: ribosome biogenesis GTPase Der [Candidatus Melainabacteria bacterium RIFCSPLOWO2_02_FULL_35_15]|nr:MAG: ribosome biogenesis GTPase Der [Candidatus Melainabacteria bacterium RIFCSPLOWO2_12_FULL_35_11]OGI13377.1 MAG: ribosome biogenesis GTPase Der [Candidatus Melainabacteria bacterium RIFCSPLOWO2_02_FULL_35_15]